MWDNRATWHKAINNYHGYRRLMHRITVEGVVLAKATEYGGKLDGGFFCVFFQFFNSLTDPWADLIILFAHIPKYPLMSVHLI